MGRSFPNIAAGHREEIAMCGRFEQSETKRYCARLPAIPYRTLMIL
jgi:hypothetical protein